MVIYTVLSKAISIYDELTVDGISDPKIKVKLQGVEHKHNPNLESASII